MRWLDEFIWRNNVLHVKAMRGVEQERLQAQAIDTVGEHLCRVHATMDRFGI